MNNSSTYQHKENAELLEEISQTASERCRAGLEGILKIWTTIYGNNDKNFTERLLKIDDDIKFFWEEQTESQEMRKTSLLKSIEKNGKEALRLEKVLGLEETFHTLHNDMPLIEMEKQVWDLLSSYEAIKKERVLEYRNLQKEEKELCSILDENPQVSDLCTGVSTSNPNSTSMEVPSSDEMERCKHRIELLQRQKEELQYEFQSYKEQLKSLLNDCGILPLSRIERAACSIENSSEIPVNKENLLKLKDTTNLYLNKKRELEQEAYELRQQIISIYKKMLKKPGELEELIKKYSGFSKHIISKLKEILQQLKEERKHKLKELILYQRTLLDDLWTRCCYSDDQRAEFKPYLVNYYSEEVLDFHELEVEHLQGFYEENKRIFQLAEKHTELWSRLLQLEEAASHTDRLFNNRGGKLLLEEKERKLIQKKLPAIKSELVTLLNEFKTQTGKDFLYFGTPLLSTLESLEEERESAKENQKRQRKAANTEHVLLESKLGTRPGAGNKRKIFTPQQPNNKVMKMSHSAASSTLSLASTKSSASAKHVQLMAAMRSPHPARERARPRLEVGNYATVHSPAVIVTPAISTPDNGAH